MRIIFCALIAVTMCIWNSSAYAEAIYDITGTWEGVQTIDAYYDGAYISTSTMSYSAEIIQSSSDPHDTWISNVNSSYDWWTGYVDGDIYYTTGPTYENNPSGVTLPSDSSLSGTMFWLDPITLGEKDYFSYIVLEYHTFIANSDKTTNGTRAFYHSGWLLDVETDDWIYSAELAKYSYQSTTASAMQPQPMPWVPLLLLGD